MYLCIFTATVITVYKHNKQKTIVYFSGQFKVEESFLKEMRHFTVTADLNVVQKKNLAWWPICNFSNIFSIKKVFCYNF